MNETMFLEYCLDIVIPVFDEEKTIPFIYERVKTLRFFTPGVTINVIFVDDNSRDQSSTILKQICYNDKQCHYLRLAKNSGSHVAIIAGLTQAKGDCSVFLAADLQDPPELIPKMIDLWKSGNHIVWAVRKRIEGISLISRLFSKLFYKIINSSSSVKLPPTGADFALLDRKVIDGLLSSVGSNPSLGSLIASLGYKQANIEYIKEARKYGKSKWTLSKKIHAFVDAIVGYSFVPMRIITYFGITVSLSGFIYALIVMFLKLLSGKQIQGWASIMVVVLIIGGVQMIMLGVIGEYLWRNLEESRKKPLFLIEDQSDNN